MIDPITAAIIGFVISVIICEMIIIIFKDDFRIDDFQEFVMLNVLSCAIGVLIGMLTWIAFDDWPYFRFILIATGSITSIILLKILIYKTCIER